MNKLTVLYDATCGFCVNCRWWLAAQPAYLELDFYPAGSPHAARLFPGLDTTCGELTVIDDEGGVYQGGAAFLMCLYALKEYRELSLNLSLPFARKVFEFISANRGRISKWFRLRTEEEVLAL